jgi:hypothetical protein
VDDKFELARVRKLAADGQVSLPVSMSGLIELLIPPGVSEPFGTYFFTARDVGAAVAKALEGKVFAEAFSDTEELFEQEWGPYEDTSVFVCVIDHRRQVPAGVLRLIVPSPVGLKTLHDIDRFWGVPAEEVLRASGVTCHPAEMWDAATIAVAKEYRGAAMEGLVSLAMLQALCVVGMRCGGTGLVTVMHLPVLEAFQERLHMPLARFKGLEPRPYYGSPASVPVWMDARRYVERLAEVDPALHRILATGTGIEEAVRPPDWNQASAKCWQLIQLARFRAKSA